MDDPPLGGSIDRIYSYGYDTDGNRTSLFVDVMGGMLEYSYIYFFDANGNQAMNLFDDGNDGIIGMVAYYTWTLM